jgi:hypothetical protein
MASDHYPIDQILADFIESNVAILVATCDAGNRPTISRGYGMRVSEDRKHVTVFVASLQSATAFRDIEKTARIVVNATRISDYESYQLKGNGAQRHEPTQQDKLHTEHYVRGLKSEMEKVGITRLQTNNILTSFNRQPLAGIKFALQEVYCQTPGPGAGKPREQRP